MNNISRIEAIDSAKPKINKIEALVDAVASYNKAHVPGSDAYKLRNPLLLLAFGFKQLESSDANRRRVFSSYVGGYRAGCLDVEMKIRKQRRGIKGPTLKDLLTSYKAGYDAALFEIIDFLQTALADPNINQDTDLQYFLEE